MSQENYIDRISTNDMMKNAAPARRSLLKTDITFTDYKGDEIINISRHKHNMTILSGRISVLEKAFGIVPDGTQRLLVSDMIPVPNGNGAASGNAEVVSMDDDPTYSSIHEAYIVSFFVYMAIFYRYIIIINFCFNITYNG